MRVGGGVQRGARERGCDEWCVCVCVCARMLHVYRRVYVCACLCVCVCAPGYKDTLAHTPAAPGCKEVIRHWYVIFMCVIEGR